MSQDDTLIGELTRKQNYDAGAMAPATVNRKAHDLLANGKIAARLAELRAPAAEFAQVSRK